ncbi:LemA family protein [Shewanella youngdeokensis]|uniref:LemA family protein n=1 Tax=Shewanella youngdeokensis TaxID=2999068 RepID=A0ABZ0K0Y7_9GAMM|nr:LemA family protein [Shewanella sp. DAU334]
MQGILLGSGLFIIVVCLWIVSLIKKRNTGREALSSIDAQLAKRSHLVPSIVASVEPFMAAEASFIAEINDLNTRVAGDYDDTEPGAVQAHLAASILLNEKVSQLMSEAEIHPHLRADSAMLQAMQTYHEVGVQLTAMQRYYNHSMVELNAAVAVFPGSIVAMLAGIKAMPLYETDQAIKTTVEASDYVK